MPKRYYIAYGSNLNILQMRWRCPSARIIGTSVILTIEQEPGYRVPVAVWEVSPADEAALDHYEGFPNFYYKREMDLDIVGIKSKKVRRRNVFVYIMHEERQIEIPGNGYMRVCLEGYKDFGFDIAPLLEAYDYSLEVAQ